MLPLHRRRKTRYGLDIARQGAGNRQADDEIIRTASLSQEEKTMFTRPQTDKSQPKAGLSMHDQQLAWAAEGNVDALFNAFLNNNADS